MIGKLYESEMDGKYVKVLWEPALECLAEAE